MNCGGRKTVVLVLGMGGIVACRALGRFNSVGGRLCGVRPKGSDSRTSQQQSK